MHGMAEYQHTNEASELEEKFNESFMSSSHIQS